MVHSECEGRWKGDLEELRQGRSFDDIAFYLPYLHSQATVLDYLPRSGLLILDDPESIQRCIAELDEQAQEMQERFERDRENPPHLRVPLSTWNKLEPQSQQLRQ